jgi:hypothetical protein
MSCKTFLISIAFLLSMLISVPLAAQESTEVLLSWPANPEPDILRYIIYRSPDTARAHFVAIDSVGSSTIRYTDGSIVKGTVYYYEIKAKSSTGATSPFSNYVSIFAVPQNASPTIQQLCQITAITSVGNHNYDVTWSNTVSTIGFVQYGGSAGFDSMSVWDNATYKTTHTVRIYGLSTPGTYFVRAAAYDNKKNMFVSAIDTLIVTPNNPAPLSTPVLSAYPVPYNPGMQSFTIDHLPKGGSASIYSETGLEVWSHEADEATTIVWKGTNRDGSRVMSGVYYLVVKDAKGKVYDRRPIMILNK